MTCNHQSLYNIGLKYCPYCGSRLRSQSNINLSKVRKMQRKWKAQHKGESVLCDAFSNCVSPGIGSYAEYVLEAKYGGPFTRDRCPDVADEMEALMDEIWAQLCPAVKCIEQKYGKF